MTKLSRQINGVNRTVQLVTFSI